MIPISLCQVQPIQWSGSSVAEIKTLRGVDIKVRWKNAEEIKKIAWQKFQNWVTEIKKKLAEIKKTWQKSQICVAKKQKKNVAEI